MEGDMEKSKTLMCNSFPWFHSVSNGMRKKTLVKVTFVATAEP